MRIDGGVSIAELAPMFGTSEIDFSSDFKIYAGEHVNVNGLLGLSSDRNGAVSVAPVGPSLDNAGSIAVASATGNVVGLNIDPELQQ